MMKSGSLVVRQHSPFKRGLFWGVLLAVMLGGGWGLYSFGQSQAGFARGAAEETMGNMRSAINELERQNMGLRDQVALLERGTQMDKQAYEEVSSNIKALQEEVLELREEVTFYRGIVAPRETSSGLRIERFELSASSATSRLHHYKLVLTQVLKNHRTIHGVVSIAVEGVQDGKPRVLTLRTLSESRKPNFSFKFRYFQKFEGDLQMPKGFQPRSVEIKVNPSKGKTVKRSFDWPDNKSEIEIEAPKAEADTSN